ncbi:MAG: hypothetical protein Q4C60_07605 [Eubacteriales bacterium]|nr:hypothetical protein [Eubacteriales bacterium]
MLEEGEMPLNSNIKEFLRGIRGRRKEIDDLVRERERLLTTLGPRALRLKEVDVQTSLPGDMMAETMAAVVSLEREIQISIHDLAMQQARAEQMIRQVDSDVHRRLLRLYYFDGLRWWQVAEEMEYTEAHVRKMHSKALEEIAQILKDDTK